MAACNTNIKFFSVLNHIHLFRLLQFKHIFATILIKVNNYGKHNDKTLLALCIQSFVHTTQIKSKKKVVFQVCTVNTATYSFIYKPLYGVHVTYNQL